MNKGKSTWKYNKLLMGRRNYFDGLSGSSQIENQPSNKKGFLGIDWNSDEGKAAINAGINAAGSLAGGLISDGYSTTAGNVMNSLSSVASLIPGWGTAAAAGLKVGAGLANRAFGVKWNEKNIANVENNIRDLNNFQSNAGDWDTLASNWSNAATGMTFNNNYIGKNGWLTGDKVGSKANDLRNQITNGENHVYNTLINNATSISKQQMNNMLANNITAYGGELHSQGGNFTNGIISINNGDSHENNPNEGVQIGVDPQGVPNLVEEGENIFNNYVYSKRINVPKAIRNKYKLGGIKNISFADASKKLSKESEERPNDPISKNGLEAIMYDLAESQEEVKAAKQAANMSVNYAAYGGKVNKFQDGGGTNDLTTPEKEEEPWKEEHLLINEDGTTTPMPDSDIYKPGINFNTGLTWEEGPGKKYTRQGNGNYAEDSDSHTRRYFYKLKEVPKEKAPAVDNYYMHNPDTGNYEIVKGDNPFNTVMNAGYEQVRYAENKTGGKDFYYKAPKKLSEVKALPTDSRYLPIVGLAGSVITDALGVTNKPDYSEANAVLNAAKLAGQYQPVRHTPIGNYLTYKPFDRDYYLNSMDAAQNAAMRNVMNTSGGNRATAQAGIINLTNNYLDKTGELARQGEEYNLAQRDKVAAFNKDTDKFNVTNALGAAEANQRALAAANSAYFSGAANAAEIRQKERLAADANKSANLSGLFTSLGNIGRENMTWNWRNFGLNTETWGNAGTNPYANLLGDARVAETNNAAKGGKIKRKKKGLTI